MLQLALGEYKDYEISTLEIDRGGMSYTIDTLLTVKSLMPAAEVFLLMGADSLRDFPYWRRPADICRTAAHFMMSDSSLHPDVCRVCADVCEACAESCARLEGMERCVEACRECEQQCRQMAGAMAAAR